MMITPPLSFAESSSFCGSKNWKRKISLSLFTRCVTPFDCSSSSSSSAQVTLSVPHDESTPSEGRIWLFSDDTNAFLSEFCAPRRTKRVV